MKPTNKQVFGTIDKGSSNADGLFCLYDTGSADRDGDTIAEDGFDLKNFRANPIALWQHDHRFPLGIWKDVKMVGSKLMGTLKLGETNLAKMVRQLIQEGTLKAVSVSFIPKSYDAQYDEHKNFLGYHFTSVELTETSLVSVPAHQGALLMAKSLNLSNDEIKLCFGETHEAAMANCAKRKTLVATLDASILKINGALK